MALRLTHIKFITTIFQLNSLHLHSKVIHHHLDNMLQQNFMIKTSRNTIDLIILNKRK